MIHKIEMFAATCDGCNEGWTDERYGFSAWHDKNAVAESIDDNEWHIADDGKTYCPKCFTVDDDDNVIIKTTGIIAEGLIDHGDGSI